MTTDDRTPILRAAVEATNLAIRQALDGPAAPRASAGASPVSDDYDEAGVNYDAVQREIEAREMDYDMDCDEAGVDYDAMLREIESLRSQLAEAREQRDQAAEALVRAEVERDEARAEVERLSACVRDWKAVNADLAARCDSGDIPIRLGERYSQAVLREIDRLRIERDAAWEAHRQLAEALAATASEAALKSPHSQDHTQVRGDSRTEPQTGSQGPLDLDAIRAAWLRTCGPCDAGYPTGCTCPPGDPRTVIAALVAEIDRLRTKRDRWQQLAVAAIRRFHTALNRQEGSR